MQPYINIPVWILFQDLYNMVEGIQIFPPPMCCPKQFFPLAISLSPNHQSMSSLWPTRTMCLVIYG